MNWFIPNTDPYVMYALKELFRWAGDNQYTLMVILTILGWLKIKATQTKTVIDDKIITYLIGLFKFDWLKKLFKPSNS